MKLSHTELCDKIVNDLLARAGETSTRGLRYVWSTERLDDGLLYHVIRNAKTKALFNISGRIYKSKFINQESSEWHPKEYANFYYCVERALKVSHWLDYSVEEYNEYLRW